MSTSLPFFLQRRGLVLGGMASSVLAHAQAPQPARHVIVAGAGMAGLSTAWALEQSGFQVTVLEAHTRIGGRNWTVRADDVVPDLAGQAQHCAFSEGQYLNAGAWRILPWHHRMLQCAARHDIPLETLFANGRADGSSAMQPAGGMDALPRALAQALRTPVRTGTAVLSVQRSGALGQAGVVVWVRSQSQSSIQRLEADYAVLALPLGALATLDIELPRNLRQDLHAVQTADAIKIALETDGTWAKDSDEDAQPFILPPYGIVPVAQRITSVYGSSLSIARDFTGTRTAQIARARLLLRPAARHATQAWRHPLVVQWSRMSWAGGAAARLPAGATQTLHALQQGLPPIFWASDALSLLNGWQEGALASAEQAVQALHSHARQYSTGH